MNVPVDQQARDAIVERLGRNACVEAGAGTGKTTVLVDRVVALLRGGRAADPNPLAPGGARPR